MCADESENPPVVLINVMNVTSQQSMMTGWILILLLFFSLRSKTFRRFLIHFVRDTIEKVLQLLLGLECEGDELPESHSDITSDVSVDSPSGSPPQSPATHMTDGYQMASSPADREGILTIETVFKKKSPYTIITDRRGRRYKVVFKEYRLHDSHAKCASAKRGDTFQDMPFGPLPPNWDKQNPDEIVKEVLLNSTSKEFLDVQNHLRDTGAVPDLTIISIARVQNPYLYRQFVIKKAHLDRQNPGQQNELKLWHGTSVDAVQNINHHGFNRSYCGKHATVYGQGVYFAVNPKYSVHTQLSPADAAGTRHLYLCRVLTGLCTQGNGCMRTLPPRKGEIQFDSATNNCASPETYIIFNDTQAYPEYLIRFRVQPTT